MPRKNSFSRLRAQNIAAALHLTITETPQPISGAVDIEVNGHLFSGWNTTLEYLQTLIAERDEIGD